jgi:hypothetical protein
MDMKKMGFPQCEVAHWNNSVAADLEALAGLRSLYPGAAMRMYACLHEILCDQPRCCFGAKVRQIVDGLEHLEP